MGAWLRLRPLAERGCMKRLLLVVFLAALLFIPRGSATPIQYRLAAILVDFQDNHTHAVTAAQIEANWLTNSNSVAAWMNETSYGERQIATVDVRGWFTIPYSSAGPCAFNTDWESAARAQAGDLSSYDHLIFIYSNFSSCPAIAYGTGSLTNGEVWGGANLGFDLGIAAHEFAHSLGLPQHAGTTACASGCALNEGGDTWTVWNGQARDLQGAERTYLGYLAATPVTTSGTYQVDALGPSTGQRVLSIARLDGSLLLVDYRKPFGIFDQSTDPRGITVHVQLADRRLSYLVGQALGVGYSVYDDANRIAITTVSLGASSAQVSIQFNSDPPPPPPPPPPQCSDGIDNDGDGKIDLADKQCRDAADNDEKHR
jgi:hypothetical protein